MEFFNYADWLAQGRKKAYAKGRPDLDTEQIHLEFDYDHIEVVYTVQLKTTGFRATVAAFTGSEFSGRFVNMMEVEA